MIDACTDQSDIYSPFSFVSASACIICTDNQTLLFSSGICRWYGVHSEMFVLGTDAHGKIIIPGKERDFKEANTEAVAAERPDFRSTDEAFESSRRISFMPFSEVRCCQSKST